MIKKPKSRIQIEMFTSLEDRISEKSPVRLIDLIVDVLFETSKETYQYKGQSHVGRPAYPMSTMMKLFIYGYVNRIKSSRCLEQECHRNIELMWLLEDLRPDFRTIAYFREDYSKLITKFSKDFRKMLRSMNLIGQEFAIDGSKFKANANKDLLARKGIVKRLSEIDQQMQSYLNGLDSSDTSDERENESENLDKLSIAGKIKELEAEVLYLKNIQNELDLRDKNYLSTTDLDCNLMTGRDGSIPGYNVQLAVDTTTKFIASDLVTDRCNDIHQLIPVVDETLSELELDTITTISDKGYFDLDDIEQLELSGKAKCYTTIYARHDYNQGFLFDKQNDCFICPQGKKLYRLQISERKKFSQVVKYFCKDCGGCLIKSECTKSPKGRCIQRYSNQEYRDEYKQRMKSDLGRSKLRKRKSTVECMFGTIKIMAGKIPLLMRGIENVRTEIKLYCLAYNFKHLINMFTFDELVKKVRDFAQNSFILSKIDYLKLNMKKFIGIFCIRLIPSHNLIASHRLACYLGRLN